jgi:beta-glucosidase
MAQTPADRARTLVQQMTVEERLSLVHGTRDPEELGEAGYWPGLPRLGIPPLRFADGPPGINVNGDATALSAPVGLAATFDVEAARLYGMVLGREAAALRQDVVLAPHLNIVRDPLFRRNHTAFSEDPLLTGEMAGAEIRGIQSQGVMALAKHLAGYNGSQNVAVDERTLHEIYLPAFGAAVRAGVASVMCAYNQINSEWACENGALQNDVLRREFGFRGFIASDWGAVHGPEAIVRGLDLEMPGREIARRGGPYFTEPLKAAVQSGAIPMAAVDRALERLLEQMMRLGMLDRKVGRGRRIDIEADARVARRIAAEGAVLLKNNGRVLPLRAADLNSAVLIGPTAGQLATGFLGERGYGFESRMVSPRSALGAVRYSPGVDLTGAVIPAGALRHDGLPGLVRRREGVVDGRRQIDRSVDFDNGNALEAGSDYSWSGMLSVHTTGDYTFLVQPVLDHGSEGGGSISIDGHLAARTGGPGFGGTGMRAKKWSSLLPTTDGRDNGRGPTLRLGAGPHRIELTANSTGESGLRIRFAWITPEMRRAGIDAAVEAARQARTAIVFAWCEAGSIELPEGQDELMAKVAAVAPRTVVVLNTGGPVLMPWKDKVGAILEMWYPGQEGGWATADILLGRVNPAGRLPVTFPRRLEDTPVHTAGHAERYAPAPPPGMTGITQNAPDVVYSEGTAVGYRWYEREKIEPLFVFGHGLSYTSFEYSNLRLTRRDEGVDVTFTLRNTGGVRGAEAPQVYLGLPDFALAVFARMELDAGASRTITLCIEKRALSFWSTEEHGWKVIGRARKVFVGASSHDIRLSGEI